MCIIITKAIRQSLTIPAHIPAISLVPVPAIIPVIPVPAKAIPAPVIHPAKAIPAQIVVIPVPVIRPVVVIPVPADIKDGQAVRIVVVYNTSCYGVGSTPTPPTKLITMVYSANKVNGNKQAYIDWVKNLAADLEGKAEEPKKQDIFPNSQDGDIATIKDLVGNFLAVLIDDSVTIK